MKWMIASDLHGSAFYCRQMIKAFQREGADRLLLLGDLLYHGPRNDLPEGYAPKEVIPLLNSLRPKLLCVRGNCDAEVDQMVLDFPILADYAVLPVGEKLIYATHGHVHNLKNPAAAGCGGYPAARSHPHPGVDRVRRWESLPEPRFPEHPQRRQRPQLHDAGGWTVPMEDAGRGCVPHMEGRKRLSKIRVFY